MTIAATLPSTDVLALAGEIFDCALDTSRWPRTLRMVAEFVGAHAAAVFSKDAASRSGQLYADDGTLDPVYTALYFNRYIKFDPTTISHCTSEVGRAICTSDIMDYGEFCASRFFTEWSRPQGIADGAFAPMERSASSVALFGVFRHEDAGPCDEAMRKRLALITPHVRRAMLVGQAFEGKTGEAAGFADTLDGLSAGVFLVDDEGRLAHANANGRAMLKARSVVDLRDERLCLAMETGGPALQNIASLTATGDAAAGAHGIALTLPARGDEAYTADVLPLAAGARRQAGARYSAAAAIFVRPAKMDAPANLEAMARRYALTPAEMRVLLAIVRFGNVPDTAEELGIAVSTVKTHVHRLLGKTGAARQNDLVKLVAGYSMKLLR